MIKLVLTFLLTLNLYALEKLRETQLSVAIQNHKIEEARLLIKKGADINRANSRGETPLLYAMRRGEYKFARELMAEGADTSVVDIAGNSALSYAIKAHKEDIALHVLENPDFNIHQLLQTTVFQGRADLYAEYIRESKPEWEQFTFLHMAARHAQSRVVQALLYLGLDIDTLTKGKTLQLDAVALGAWYGDKKTVEVLLDNGADAYRVYINRHPEGNYGLYYMGGLSGKYTLLSLSLNAQHIDKESIEYILSLKDAKKYATLDSKYFYLNMLFLSNYSKKDSIYRKVLKRLDEWDYPQRELIKKAYLRKLKR
jgi:hypothetical protein